MPKYRKRPVAIDAYQVHEDLYVDTLEGRMHASPGDWIVVGVHGERYPVKPDIFEKTYEPAGESEGDGATAPEPGASPCAACC